MAKCRNCKKEIDATATRCPYCLTEMPTSDFIATLKGIVIALILLGVFGVAMYLMLGSVFRSIVENASAIIKSIAFFVGVMIGGLAIQFFKWAIKREVSDILRSFIFGIVCAGISIFLIFFSLSII